MPDISETLAPKSDQLDNIDLRGGPHRIFTVTKVDVRPGAEQPVTVHLAEFPRPWKPGKNMRRVLAYCWGRESDNWTGKRVELYSDEKVKFGNETPGGTRISRLSHIDGPKTAPLIVSQGKSGVWKVEPLPDVAPATPEPTLADRIENMVAQFGKGGVTREQMETRLGRASSDWTADDVADMTAVFQSLKAKETTVAEAFPGGGS